ncbi:MAG: hypothetical protein K9L26_03780 [Candidatus Izimaplasma sp.]|nr:hypothetical protein [Candidatus Izimaplasma bacterium]
MKYDEVLEKIESGSISAEEAFDELFPIKKAKPGKRATFIKMNVQVPDESKGLNTFLKILFALPIPMVFARLGLRLGKRFAKLEDEDVDFDQIMQLLKYSRHTKIQVESEEAVVDIKII